MKYGTYLQEIVAFQLLFPVAFKNKWQSSYTAAVVSKVGLSSVRAYT